jgi:hypothetical protein
MSRRRGFTLVEVTLVAALTVFLAVLLSSVWKNIGLFTTDAVGRGRLMQEMDLAAASFSRDLAGSAPVLATSTFGNGKPDSGRWVGWQHPGNTELWLCYDGGTCPNGTPDWTGANDTVIRYYLADDPNPDVNQKTGILIRENRSDNPPTSFIVARNLDRTNGLIVDADGEFVKITLQFKYQQHSGSNYFGPEYVRAFTLEARAPQ